MRHPAWFVLALAACATSAPVPRSGPTLRERFGDHPFLTPIDAPTTVRLVAGGEIDTRASACGDCHAENHAEWAASTHASAVRDPQFFAEMQKPDQPRWLCLNCHAPTSPQRDQRITLDTRLASADSVAAVDAAANPDFDPSRVAEGVTCAACHVRRDADGAGVIVGPHGSERAPHRVRADPDALAEVCVDCHSPGADIVITPTFPCWFTTAEEVAAGPTPGATCTSCHMPLADRPAATGAPSHPLRRHLWTGGGIPKRTADFATLLQRAWVSGLDVRVQSAPLRIALANAGAAHALPTGDPERFLRIEATAYADAGPALDSAILRVGQTWDWGDARAGRPARRTGDTRLLPGETRTWEPPISLTGASRVEVEVLSVRLTAANAASMAGLRLDADLVGLWPGAQDAVDALPSEYPVAAYAYRGVIDLRTGEVNVDSPEERIASSAALAALPAEVRAERLKVSPP